MEKNSKILVLGNRGLVGSAIIRELEKQGYENIIIAERSKCDLMFMNNVADLFHTTKPEYVFNAAAKVGGINANNTKSAEFIKDNLVMQTIIIEACHIFQVKKLLFLGSSCIYPKLCPQPIKEEYLMTSELEETNIGYAIAKIAGLTMCRMYKKQYGDNFISAMPTNLYGPNDNFKHGDSHVLPAVIRKLHEAKINNLKEVEFWGTGSAMREFLFVDDLAEALVFLMNNYNDPTHINVGTGKDVTIKQLVELGKKVIGYEGDIMWNSAYPDGTPRKLLDVTKINKLGWEAKTSLEEGLIKTYKWFNENYNVLNSGIRV